MRLVNIGRKIVPIGDSQIVIRPAFISQPCFKVFGIKARQIAVRGIENLGGLLLDPRAFAWRKLR